MGLQSRDLVAELAGKIAVPQREPHGRGTRVGGGRL
jgi:hypothetical protein